MTPGKPAWVLSATCRCLTGLLHVAITRRLLPGTLPLPGEWDIQLLAAFFPGTPIEDIEYVDENAGHDLRSDEVGYCVLISQPDAQ
jgi:hypothetical protein